MTDPASSLLAEGAAVVPSLERELHVQQEMAMNRLTGGIVFVLAAFAVLGIGKYWAYIPLTGGLVWSGILVGLLLLPLWRIWRRRTGRRALLQGVALRRASLLWTFAVGCHFAWAVSFAMPTDDNVGRTTFAVMAFGLGGMTLATTYMVPRLAMAFLAPIIAATLYGSLVSDEHVSSLQKILMMIGFVITAVVIVRVNWLAFRSGVQTMVDREKHRLEVMQRRQEIEAASRIQNLLLPQANDLPEAEDRFDLAVKHRSAEEMTGDLYDFFMIDDHRLCFMVGDVCGKGVTSSLLMAMTKVMLKSAVLRHDRAMGDVISEVSRELLREDHDDQFVTCFAGILDLDTGVIDYCNAGHEPARMITTDRAEPAYSPRAGGPPLCSFGDVAYESGHLSLTPGATLLIVTDGVTEARNAAGAEFGPDRLDRALSAAHGETEVGTMLQRIDDSVAAFVAGHAPSDDLTMLALRWHGSKG